MVLPASKIICLQADFRALINSLKFVVPIESADFKAVISPKVNSLCVTVGAECLKAQELVSQVTHNVLTHLQCGGTTVYR